MGQRIKDNIDKKKRLHFLNFDIYIFININIYLFNLTNN